MKMKHLLKKAFLLLALIGGTNSAWAADEVVLFSTDFSDASWSTYTSESPITAKSTVNGIYFNCADYVTNNALKFNGGGNASGARYCAIHVTGVNGSVKITVNYNAKARAKYRIVEETGYTTGMGESTDPGANNDHNTIVNYNMTGEGDELTFYFYQQGSGAPNIVNDITITTPDKSVQQYTATFANGGHGTAPSSIKGASVTLPTLGESWYTNTGWVADQDVKVNDETVTAGTTIDCGTAVAMSANTTFTAQWTTGDLPYVEGVKFASKPASALNVASETATNGYVTYIYQSLRPAGTKDWATENGGGSASGQKWTVPEGSPFVGNSEGVNVTSVQASAKTYTVLFTGTTEVQVIGNSRKDGVYVSAMLVDYTSTPSIVETKTIGNLGSDAAITIASEDVLKFEDLDDSKTYAIFFYAADGQNSLLYEIAFKQLTSVVSANITSAGWATLYTDKALDFSGVEGLTAYTATCSEGVVALAPVDNVPANTGVVLKGAEGNYNIPVIASSETAQGHLKGSATEATAYNAFTGFTLYVLTSVGANVQFNPVTSGSIAAGKAYLKVDGGTSSARPMEVVFADEILTGINEAKSEIKAAKEGKFVVDGKLRIFSKGKMFNANGQLVK